MSWATLWSPALGHLRAATNSINACLGLSCGQATLVTKILFYVSKNVVKSSK